jgi:transcriptional regulator with XRE-family HTH domain
LGYRTGMGKIHAVHKGRQPRRPHFIEAWATARGFNQAGLARELEADKSVVSRWFSGTTPGVEWQERLAVLFHCEPEALFRHPDDDWLAKFFEGRSRAEIEKMKQVLEITFPRKRGEPSNSAA